MTLKLTPAQTALMETFDSLPDLKPETQWGCTPGELRVAKACAEKGPLDIKGAPVRGEHFEISLTSLGVSVSQCLLEKRVRDAATT
ncbi:MULTISPECIES: hypothetical protein [Burkholderia]|uniref:hypothetical protein n=1 Tax=Burkholderia TaxID=32008 RepID=UPI00119A1320|nr:MULTISPECIES: hypothetical protein [Burkholderia]MCQ0034659.1 hypothetical protein [Burkholderia glumae]MCQ0040252.1 hypothetical protein [Burkholderia glumae]TWC57511.1 hypothetical protein FB600_1427 [Burkholderia sp. SJZ089]TWC92482.1 hypothetical protein FBX98_1427 [Burkholderia sp. SJZ115]TWC95486.1 hypothetical protein FB601_1427 [Burkholderia sp. SJZ091]